MATNPTAIQTKIIDFVSSFIDEKGCSPTYAEVAEHMGTVVSTAQGHVERMLRKGLLARADVGGDSRRTLIVPGRRSYPLYTVSERGIDSTAPTTFRLSDTLDGSYAAYRVRDASLPPYQPGDVLLVDPTRDPKVGDTVLTATGIDVYDDESDFDDEPFGVVVMMARGSIVRL